MTNYSDYSLPEILEHIVDWQRETKEGIARLKDFRSQIEARRTKLKNPDVSLLYIDFFESLLEGFLCDLDRLIVEIPCGVHARHFEIVAAIFENSSSGEDRCVYFKRDYIEEYKEDEENLILMRQVYGFSRDLIIDYKDLSNLNSRLKTYEGTALNSPTPETLGGVDLRPNIFGLGLNFNYYLARLADWWKSKKKAN